MSSGEAATHRPAPAPAPVPAPAPPGLRHRGACTGCTAGQAHGPRRGTTGTRTAAARPKHGHLAQGHRTSDPASRGTGGLASARTDAARGLPRAPPAPPRPGLTPALGQEHARPLEGVLLAPDLGNGPPTGPGGLRGSGDEPGTPERAANRRPAGHREAGKASSHHPARGHAAPSAPRPLWPGLKASIRSSCHWP